MLALVMPVTVIVAQGDRCGGYVANRADAEGEDGNYQDSQRRVEFPLHLSASAAQSWPVWRGADVATVAKTAQSP